MVEKIDKINMSIFLLVDSRQCHRIYRTSRPTRPACRVGQTIAVFAEIIDAPHNLMAIVNMTCSALANEVKVIKHNKLLVLDH